MPIVYWSAVVIGFTQTSKTTALAIEPTRTELSVFFRSLPILTLCPLDLKNHRGDSSAYSVIATSGFLHGSTLAKRLNNNG